MSLKKTAYDTTACAGTILKKVFDTLQDAKATYSLRRLDGEPSILMVEGSNSYSQAIPSFNHPVFLNERGSDKEGDVVVDLRNFGWFDPKEAQFVVRVKTDYDLAIRRAVLTSRWIFDKPEHMRNLTVLPMALYSYWISTTITKRLSLDPAEHVKIQILAAILYYSQFEEDNFGDSESEKMRCVKAISAATRIDAQLVMEVVDQVPYIEDVKNFCLRCAEVTGSVRLQQLNQGLLFSLLGASWYGSSAVELVAVALEHPPTWLTIVLAACTERNFKKAGLTQMLELSLHRQYIPNFVRAIESLCAPRSSGSVLPAPGY